MISLNYSLAGSTDNSLRGDTDVTHHLSVLHRAQPDLCHGPGRPGEPFSAGTTRRTVRAYRSTAIPPHPAVLLGRRVDARGGPGRRADGLRRLPEAAAHAPRERPGRLRQTRRYGTGAVGGAGHG